MKEELKDSLKDNAVAVGTGAGALAGAGVGAGAAKLAGAKIVGAKVVTCVGGPMAIGAVAGAVGIGMLVDKVRKEKAAKEKKSAGDMLDTDSD